MHFSSGTDSGGTASALWCCFFGAGIIGSLVIYGLLQERIMTVPYGEELFKFSVFLVFMNRAAAVLFSAAMIAGRGESFTNTAPIWKYLAISGSNVSASACQYEALKYVSFPVQMLGKSFKMMPVMVWGLLIANKSYDRGDWLIAAAVTGGVTEFLLTGQIDAESDDGRSNHAIYGLCLLLCFLLLDGFTSTFQEKLFKEYKTTKYNQMLYVNLGSVSVSFLTLVLSGTLDDALGFCAAYPAFLGDAVSLSAAAVAGQWFIYSQVKEYGALVFAATMNVRQVVSILLSYATYGHVITWLQVLGLLLVFAALFYKTYLGLSTDGKGERAPLVTRGEPGKEVPEPTKERGEEAFVRDPRWHGAGAGRTFAAEPAWAGAGVGRWQPDDALEPETGAEPAKEARCRNVYQQDVDERQDVEDGGPRPWNTTAKIDDEHTDIAIGFCPLLEKHYRKPFEEDYKKNLVAAEQRLASLESLSLISALLAGFQLSSIVAVDLKSAAWDWYAHANLIYILFSLLAFMGFLYPAVLGAFVKVAIKRVGSWDDKLLPKEPEAIWKHKDYESTMKILYGSDTEKWLKRHRDNAKEEDGKEEEVRILKIPLAYWVFRESCEGPTSLVGIAVLMLPWAVFCFVISTGLMITRTCGTDGNVLAWCLLMPFSLVMLFASQKYVRLFVM